MLNLLERPQEAVPFVEEALARCERYAGRQATPDRLALLAMCRLARAEVAQANGDPRAEALAQQALDALRPVGNPAVKAAALYAVGVARVDRGEGADALKILQEADTLLGQAFPKGSPAQAALALSLAASYQQLGNPVEARMHLERSLEIWERARALLPDRRRVVADEFEPQFSAEPTKAPVRGEPIRPATSAATATAEEAEHDTPVDRSIFRAYDIRGIVGKTLSKGVARLIGRAIGSEAQHRGLKEIAVARDGRLSGPDLVASLIEGLRASGCDVIDIGTAPCAVQSLTMSGRLISGRFGMPTLFRTSRGGAWYRNGKAGRPKG